MVERAQADEAEHCAPGSFGCHEAMHMAMVLAEMVDRQLVNHPAVQHNPDWCHAALNCETVF